MTTENTTPELPVPSFSFQNKKVESSGEKPHLSSTGLFNPNAMAKTEIDETVYSEWLLDNPAGLPFLLAVTADSQLTPTWKTLLGISPYDRKLKKIRKLLYNENKVSDLTSQLDRLGYKVLNSVPIDLPHAMVNTAIISPTGLIFFIHILHDPEDKMDMAIEHEYFTHRFHLYDSQIISVLVQLEKSKKPLDIVESPNQRVVHLEDLIEFIKKEEKKHDEQQLSTQLNNYHATGEVARQKDESKGVIKEVQLPSQIYKLLDPNTWSDEWEGLDIDRVELVAFYKRLNAQHNRAKFMRRLRLYAGILVILGAATYWAVIQGYFDELLKPFL